MVLEHKLRILTSVIALGSALISNAVYSEQKSDLDEFCGQVKLGKISCQVKLREYIDPMTGYWVGVKEQIREIGDFIDKYDVCPNDCLSLKEFDEKIWPEICAIGRVKDVRNRDGGFFSPDVSDIYFDDGRMASTKIVRGIVIGKFNVIYNCRGSSSDAYVVPDSEVHCWKRVLEEMLDDQ